jgi:hypothetical protein
MKGESMNAIYAGCLSLAGALVVNLAAPNAAHADQVIVESSAPPAAVESGGTLPNRDLLRSGVFTLGASYVPALVVAIESDRSADEHLYAPIVGPWLDLAHRDDDCDGACDKETANKVLLVADGVFQGIGALQLVGAFIFPETRAVTIANGDGTPAVSFTVVPTRLATGNGLVAVGNF